MHLIALLALAASPAALAGEYGGGGMIFGDAYIPDTPLTWMGDSAASAPGDIECVGGTGFGVTNARVRSGGEGTYCSGDGFSMAYGGFLAGHDVDLGPLYGSAYSTVGIGWMGIANPEYQDEDFRVLDHGMLYVKPTLALGIPIRWAAIELGVYAFANVSFGQQASSGPLWSTPHVGSQISVLFGGFENRRDWYDTGDAVAHDADWDHGDVAEHPQCNQDSSCPF